MTSLDGGRPVDRSDRDVFPAGFAAGLGILAAALAVSILFAARNGAAFAMTALAA